MVKHSHSLPNELGRGTIVGIHNNAVGTTARLGGVARAGVVAASSKRIGATTG